MKIFNEWVSFKQVKISITKAFLIQFMILLTKIRERIRFIKQNNHK
jgi:hypothetical protein